MFWEGLPQIPTVNATWHGAGRAWAAPQAAKQPVHGHDQNLPRKWGGRSSFHVHLVCENDGSHM